MRKAKLLFVAIVLVLAPAVAMGNGFALFEHSARSVALGGAFCAIADDASASYYNPAGLAFLEGTQVMAGAYLITQSSKMWGDNPYPGDDYSVGMVDQVFYPLHMHLAGKLGDRIGWSVSTYSPFGLGTWWPDDYAGRFITKRVDLLVFAINPNIAFKISDRFAIAVGLDYFISHVELTKSLGAINPYTQQVAEVGQVHMYSKLNNTGLGHNAAVMVKLSDTWSLGASYRSRVKIEYDAKASFRQFETGYADYDALVSGLLPFDSTPKGYTEVNYPAQYRLGIAWRPGTLGLSVDVVRMDWDSFQELPIIIDGRPDLSSSRYEGYKDAYTYRVGIEYRTSEQWAWLFGALWDETPVPTEAVSPLLPDADRWGVSLGFTYNVTAKLRCDLGFLHLVFLDRSTEGKDADNYNGEYKSRAELLGITFGYTF